jgi:hypothetical protein
MNIVEKIKAEQIAAAADKGEENPYLHPHGCQLAKSVKRMTLVEKIKSKQVKEGVAPAATPTSGKDLSNLFEQLQAAMETDIARIKTYKTVEEKLTCKAELLPAYLPFVNDYMKNGHDYPNSVAVQVMIWLFDTAQIEPGLTLGLYLAKVGQQNLPKQFDRDLITFICDEVYDWAKFALADDNSASPYLDTLVATSIEQKWDLHPAVMSKNMVMLAKHKNRLGEFNEAIALCDLAEQANPKGAGVKGLRKAAEKALEALAK